MMMCCTFSIPVVAMKVRSDLSCNLLPVWETQSPFVVPKINIHVSSASVHVVRMCVNYLGVLQHLHRERERIAVLSTLVSWYCNHAIAALNRRGKLCVAAKGPMLLDSLLLIFQSCTMTRLAAALIHVRVVRVHAHLGVLLTFLNRVSAPSFPAMFWYDGVYFPTTLHPL